MCQCQQKNPPAFPWNGQGTWVPEKGMTLRDYFAAKAMQADLEYQGLEGREDIPNVAAMAYYMADAMLAERAK
jgi:hypothetical protein